MALWNFTTLFSSQQHRLQSPVYHPSLHLWEIFDIRVTMHLIIEKQSHFSCRVVLLKVTARLLDGFSLWRKIRVTTAFNTLVSSKTVITLVSTALPISAWVEESGRGRPHTHLLLLCTVQSPTHTHTHTHTRTHTHTHTHTHTTCTNSHIR